MANPAPAFPAVDDNDSEHDQLANDDDLLDIDNTPANTMAAVAVPPPLTPPSNPTSRDAGVAKRVRAAPAKTFQCKGYGDCRMVFSRSEHLARHVRKHTGERPFACHCSKQFSRLDNLRQHAQTVHADKQDQNELMMRELTALHTSMSAAHKANTPRGKRAQQQLASASGSSSSSSTLQQPHVVVPTQPHPSLPIPGPSVSLGPAAAVAASMGAVDPSSGPRRAAEEMQRSLSANYGQQHPGTSLGYDVGPDQNGSLPPGFPAATSRTWQQQQQQQHELDNAAAMAQSAARRGPFPAAQSSAPSYPAYHAANSHSFRDSSQSFRVPPAATFPGSAAAASTSTAAATAISPTTPAQQQQQQREQLQFQFATSGGGQSFLPPIDVSAPALRPASSSGGPPATAATTSSAGSRPPTAGGASQRTPLPPFAAVVAHSLAPPQHRPPVLSVPASSADARRPGTAPAAYLSHRSLSAGGAPGGGRLGMVPFAGLPVHSLGRDAFAQHRGELLGSAGAGFGYDASANTAHQNREYGQHANFSGSSSSSGGFGNPPSPPGAHVSNESPFSFHPPSLAEARAGSSSGGFERRSSSSGSDRSDDDGLPPPPFSSGGIAARPPPPTPSTAGGVSGGGGEYEYGSESRPQSRRLSVMDLLNDSNAPAGVPAAGDYGRPFLPVHAGTWAAGASRPSTAGGRFAGAYSRIVPPLTAPAAFAAATNAGGSARPPSPIDESPASSPVSASGGGIGLGLSAAGAGSAAATAGGLHAFRRHESSSPTGSAAAGVLPPYRRSPTYANVSGVQFARRSSAGGSASPLGFDEARRLSVSPSHSQSSASPTGVRV
ncbi:hypothetical protein SCHPADRAFT_935154 [Schizopora paradoxa]|uniref:C2H2-type domain-containing protein n=1 Tax=Schizopora paradoxa TaxID=27342 RepID=A0A0H2SRF8_9AGAM|nr:hypothetical protein SCHPADRAFT_935154 [Schizopora paradoxa]